MVLGMASIRTTVLQKRMKKSGRKVHAALLGFMRSYSILIQHPSDFALALQKGLLRTAADLDLSSPIHSPAIRDVQPQEKKMLTYTTFITFISNFSHSRVADSAVSPRYAYGELRLSRLNMWSKVVLRRFTFQKTYGDYNGYFNRFFGPLLFVFAVLSVVLSAFQVSLAAYQTAFQLADEASDSGIVFFAVSRWVSILVLIGVLGVGLMLGGLFVVMAGRETIFALGALTRKRREERR